MRAGKAYWFYTWAPKNVLQMCFGGALAFFGGTYMVSIAAVEVRMHAHVEMGAYVHARLHLRLRLRLHVHVPLRVRVPPCPCSRARAPTSPLCFQAFRQMGWQRSWADLQAVAAGKMHTHMP